MAESQHRQLAERRKALGYTQESFAELLRLDRTTVVRWESGKTLPRPGHRRHLARALGLTIDELHNVLANASQERSAEPEEFIVGPSLVEDPASILERMNYEFGELTDELLDDLEIRLHESAARYEAEGPTVLAPEVVRQRRWAHQLLMSTPPSKRGMRLLHIAARSSAQLSYMAVNLGRFESAHAYALEAFQLADELGDDGLKAWVRGTESFGAYYQGDYVRALELARYGLRYAHNGPQTVRLVVNGEARALAKIGERQATARAIGRSFELLDRFEPEVGMSPCMSFGVYSEARVASNAATAYLSVGNTEMVLEHSEQARLVVDRSPSVWSQALVRLDTATALLQADEPDLEHATSLAREATQVREYRPVESVRQRAEAFIAELAPWADEPRVVEFLEEQRLTQEPPDVDI